MERAPAWLRLVLQNPNPEVALSLRDLFDTAVAEQDRHRFEGAIQQVKEGEDASAAGHRLEAYYDGEERAALAVARIAKQRLVQVLNWYFRFRHGADREAGRETRGYVRQQLAALN